MNRPRSAFAAVAVLRSAAAQMHQTEVRFGVLDYNRDGAVSMADKQ